MVLRVPSDSFLAEFRTRFGEGAPIYVAPRGRGTVVSAGSLDGGFVLASEFPAKIAEVEPQLRSEGFDVKRGQWSDTMDEPDQDEMLPWIQAVAYDSEETRPGLWIDADYYERTEGEILKRMHAEFVAHGEIKDIPLEDFVKVLRPTVVQLAPQDIERFAEDKQS